MKTLDDYKAALENAGPRLAELLLAEARTTDFPPGRLRSWPESEANCGHKKRPHRMRYHPAGQGRQGRQGKARQGWARLGMAWRGKVRKSR